MRANSVNNYFLNKKLDFNTHFLIICFILPEDAEEDTSGGFLDQSGEPNLARLPLGNASTPRPRSKNKQRVLNSETPEKTFKLEDFQSVFFYFVSKYVSKFKH